MDARTSNEVRETRVYSKQNPDEIKNDIDRTRAHLDESVVALSHRLSPRRFADEFINTFTGSRSSGGGHGLGGIAGEGGQILRSIRDHPVPAALIGAGVAWFFIDRARGDGERPQRGRPTSTGRHGEREWLAPGATYEPHEEQGEGMGGRLKEKASEFKHKASDATHSVRERAGQTAGKMRDMAHTTGESISHMGHAAREKMHNARERFGDGERLRDKASRTSHKVRDVIEEHPLAIGAAALAIGLFAGLAAPSTRGERRVMGGMRDDLMEEAQHAAQDIGPRIRETAMAAAHAGVEGATGRSKEGAGEQLSESASEGIHRAGEAIREEMRSGRQQSSDNPQGDRKSDMKE